MVFNGDLGWVTFTLLLITALLVKPGSGSDSQEDTVSTCRPEFDGLTPEHTMCKKDSDNVERAGVSRKERKIILKYHNKVRQEVQPPATDLTDLTWDHNLAEVAQKLTQQCKMYHDANRKIPAYTGLGIGQNLAAGQEDWSKAMEAWFNEVKLYKYGEDPKEYLGNGGWTKIAHYTQMVSNRTLRVGCGFTECKNTRYTRFYACNYAQGQLGSGVRYPYTKGTKRCSDCSKSCKKGLCACKGRLCFNRGKLDINTCKCQCTAIYKGKTCTRLRCPNSDSWHCSDKSQCEKYWNIPIACPYMCGICNESDKKGKGKTKETDGSPGSKTSKKKPAATTAPTTSNAGFVSPYDCRYTGQRLTLDECKNHGDRGSDTVHCQSKGDEDKFSCADCTKYSNVKTDYCPVMCGMCDPPCGMICQNGGTLDPDTCKCKCRGPYRGKLCEILECPEKDPSGCGGWPYTHCKKYGNVPYDCPYLCKICPPEK